MLPLPVQVTQQWNVKRSLHCIRVHVYVYINNGYYAMGNLLRELASVSPLF